MIYSNLQTYTLVSALSPHTKPHAQIKIINHLTTTSLRDPINVVPRSQTPTGIGTNLVAGSRGLAWDRRKTLKKTQTTQTQAARPYQRNQGQTRPLLARVESDTSHPPVIKSPQSIALTYWKRLESIETHKRRPRIDHKKQRDNVQPCALPHVGLVGPVVKRVTHSSIF